MNIDMWCGNTSDEQEAVRVFLQWLMESRDVLFAVKDGDNLTIYCESKTGVK